MAPGKAEARYLVVTGPATRSFPEVYFSAPPRGGSLTSLSVRVILASMVRSRKNFNRASL